MLMTETFSLIGFDLNYSSTKDLPENVSYSLLIEPFKIGKKSILSL